VRHAKSSGARAAEAAKLLSNVLFAVGPYFARLSAEPVIQAVVAVPAALATLVKLIGDENTPADTRTHNLLSIIVMLETPHGAEACRVLQQLPTIAALVAFLRNLRGGPGADGRGGAKRFLAGSAALALIALDSSGPAAWTRLLASSPGAIEAVVRMLLEIDASFLPMVITSCGLLLACVDALLAPGESGKCAFARISQAPGLAAAVTTLLQRMLAQAYPPEALEEAKRQQDFLAVVLHYLVANGASGSNVVAAAPGLASRLQEDVASRYEASSARLTRESAAQLLSRAVTGDCQGRRSSFNLMHRGGGCDAAAPLLGGWDGGGGGGGAGDDAPPAETTAAADSPPAPHSGAGSPQDVAARSSDRSISSGSHAGVANSCSQLDTASSGSDALPTKANMNASAAPAASAVAPSADSCAAPQPSATTTHPDRCCAMCGAASGAGGGLLRLCSGCRSVRYCSQDCYKAGWKGGHRQECAALAAAREAGGGGQAAHK
jgi:hypothetical protein